MLHKSIYIEGYENGIMQAIRSLEMRLNSAKSLSDFREEFEFYKEIAQGYCEFQKDLV